MLHLRHFAAALLLIAFVGSPAAACLVAASHMTPDEEQCCREMAGDCGKVVMPVAHSCCPAVKRDGSMAVALKVTKLAPALLAVAVADFSAPVPGLQPARFSPDHSPPESPPGSISVLKI